MEKWKIVEKVWEHLRKEGIVENATLTFNQPANFTFFNGDSNQINIGLEEVEKDSMDFAAIKFLLHEVGHYLHQKHEPEDFFFKEEERAEYEWEVMAIEDEELRYEVYRDLPLEKEANALMEILWEQVVEDWERIFAAPFPKEGRINNEKN